MNAVARPWIGLVFNMLAVLAAIFAFVFVMRMMEDRSANQKMRDNGVVSRAVVTAKELDQAKYIGRRGNSRTVDYQVLHIRHVPKSTVRFADFPAKVKEADLPAAPPPSGDPLKDSANSGVMFVSQALYDQTKVGDVLVVANTPWDSDSPELVSDVTAFDGGAAYYPRIGIALILTVLFWLIGRRIRKAAVLAASDWQKRRADAAG